MGKYPLNHVFLTNYRMLTQLEVKKSTTNTGVKIFSFHGELDETNVDTTFPNIINDIDVKCALVAISGCRVICPIARAESRTP